MGRQPRILIVVNVDWFFLSHRLPIARAARDQGAEVTVAAADTGCAQEIRKEGFQYLPLPMSRTGTNPMAELGALRFLAGAYRRIKPDLIHHVTIKPVIYGSLAARITGFRNVVNAVSGLGYALSEDRKASLLRPVTRTLYRLALGSRSGIVVFQNPDDRDDFLRMGLVERGRTVLIRGSGVDCARFTPAPEPAGGPVVMFAGRMLLHKGVGVFVEAARLLREAHPGARFVLVGAVDEHNPAGIPADQIRAWTEQGIVEWWGDRSDMPEVLAQAHIVVLPSIHREGLPKVLLEAAASARALVASDVPGCREIVLPNVNGLLAPPGDAVALARALRELVESPELRRRFGLAGRALVEREFSLEIIVRQTLDLYRRMLGGRWQGKEAGG